MGSDPIMLSAGGGIRSVGKTWLGNDLFAGSTGALASSLLVLGVLWTFSGGSTAGRCLSGSEGRGSTTCCPRAHARAATIADRHSKKPKNHIKHKPNQSIGLTLGRPHYLAV